MGPLGAETALTGVGMETVATAGRAGAARSCHVLLAVMIAIASKARRHAACRAAELRSRPSAMKSTALTTAPCQSEWSNAQPRASACVLMSSREEFIGCY